ncbi:MAG: 3-deoxy-D-manno-octulosonic acid transferase [Magnetospirillum sp. WYHS-4]
MMLTAYRWLTSAATPLIRRHLAARMARGKEDSERFGERLGLPGRPRPEGFLTWIHAASVGEALSVVPLAERLLAARPGSSVLVTTGTVTSAALMADRLPAGSFHQFVPVDLLPYVESFLDHWRPGLVLWAESEFWPNLLCEIAARQVPMVLVNGRISDRSFARWRWFPESIGRLLGGFALCLGQTETDAERLRALGARRAECRGNLKFSALPLPCSDADLKRLEEALGGRPRWLAASTHPGEEALVARVHRRLAERFPDLLTLVVPRHAERGGKVAADMEEMGLAVAQRSAGEAIVPETAVYVADTMGELGLFYRLAGIAAMGKSLLPPGGGQNPLEPARLGCAVLHGPFMGNFAEMIRRMAETGASREAADEGALVEAVARLLADPAACRRAGEAARAFADSEAGALDAVMEALLPFLEPPGHAGA